MNELCKLLLKLAIDRCATDIHLESAGNDLEIWLRADEDLEKLDQDIFHANFLEYLKFISGMDLCAPFKPQSGDFAMDVDGVPVECRFSLMNTDTVQTGVIRLLHAARQFSLEDLGHSKSALERLERLSHTQRGLVISCGPTGSGKSTTVHALLNRILDRSSKKIVTLEDPIEIHEERMIQIPVAPERGITYESSIEELLRHDPDILYFGECRSSYTAKMTLRASLTGHLVFTTLHCGSGIECLYRLMDLGVDEQELKSVLRGIFVCRLIRKNHRKECIYEIWNEEDIERLFKQKERAHPGLSFEACGKECRSSEH